MIYSNTKNTESTKKKITTMEEKEFNAGEFGTQPYLKEYYPDGELNEAERTQLVRKANETAEKTRSVRRFTKHLRAFGNYLFDPEVKWYKKAVVAAALIYFISPLDSIPDFVPLAGFLDDIGVIAWTVRFLGKEIEGYY